jgi:hypothetical protein
MSIIDDFLFSLVIAIGYGLAILFGLIWLYKSTMNRTKNCSTDNHMFALEDLKTINPNSSGDDRVEWKCNVCDKVFHAQCGLDIAPKHGYIFRRSDVQSRTPTP